MATATAFQTNFSAGEISPRLFARVDVAKYANGCYQLENFIVQRFGGIRKRGGTEFIAEVKDSADITRLMPFIFSTTQAYVLEHGDGYVRYYTNSGRVEVTGTPVEDTTPYDQTEVFDLQFAQSADVLYLTHPDYAPRTLSRVSATNFTLETVDFEDGPFLELNTTATTLTPASYGALTPEMTSLTAPSGTVDSTGDLADAWEVFDKSGGSAAEWSGTSGFVSYQLASSATAVVNRYWLTAPDAEQSVKMPIAWKFEGSSNGATWVTLDSQQGESGWAGGETRFYEFANQTAYEYHRFRWTSNDDTGGSPNTMIIELGINKDAASQTAFNLTASSTTGINDGSGFQTTDVGRAIRLLGSDGRWRWAEVIARTSSTVVTIKLHGHALPDLSPIINWRMGAWSDETGWPACVGFFNGRLCFARTDTQPQTVWMSVVDDFNNFTVSDPIQDDDAITATIASDSLNEIKWIAEGTDLFLGTTAAIRTIGPTSASAAFSPTNIRQKRETNFGASEVQPVRVGTTALYSGYYRRDLREIAYSFESNGYVSQDLSILSEHIPDNVKQIAYAQNPDSVVWMVMDDGSLAGMTYERDQEVIAFHTHTIGGTDVTVESVATIPGTDGDEVWLIVKRTINGATKRYVERLTRGISDPGTLASATFLDSHLAYSGPSTSTITGLDHLEGESVYVWGTYTGTSHTQGPYTVTGGSITLGFAVTNAKVGLAYTSTMQTLSPEAAARGGTAQTRLGRISEVFLRLNRSMNGSCGPSDGTMEPLDYTLSTDNDGNYGQAHVVFTGDVRVPIAMEWGRQKRIKITHSDPSPFHLLGIITEIKVSG